MNRKSTGSADFRNQLQEFVLKYFILSRPGIISKVEVSIENVTLLNHEAWWTIRATRVSIIFPKVCWAQVKLRGDQKGRSLGPLKDHAFNATIYSNQFSELDMDPC